MRDARRFYSYNSAARVMKQEVYIYRDDAFSESDARAVSRYRVTNFSRDSIRASVIYIMHTTKETDDGFSLGKVFSISTYARTTLLSPARVVD